MSEKVTKGHERSQKVTLIVRKGHKKVKFIVRKGHKRPSSFSEKVTKGHKMSQKVTLIVRKGNKKVKFIVRNGHKMLTCMAVSWQPARTTTTYSAIAWSLGRHLLPHKQVDHGLLVSLT